MNSSKYVYKRVMLKLSGEALKGDKCHGYDEKALEKIVKRVEVVLAKGVQLAIVVGAGNLWRGNMGVGFDRCNADYMGMLATAMNSLALKEFFRQSNIPCSVFSTIDMAPAINLFNRDKAIKLLEQGEVVIFAGGTGSPFFTTDTAAVLKALEVECDLVIKATKVDGIYSSDPFKDPQAVRFSSLSFDEALEKHLKVMDATAFSLCRDNNLDIAVLNFSDPEALGKVLMNDLSAGTIVKGAL